MLGAALTFGASLISGLFGQSSAKKQAKKEEDAIREANNKAEIMASRMNAEVRARADAAALVPVATERESRSYVDMEGFMSAAEENGFNPLTFLRSGALSLFAHTEDWTCTTGESAMEAALSGTYLPQLSPVIAQTKVPSIGEVFGNALQAGTTEYVDGLNQQQQNQFQMQLLGMQLAGANRNGSSLSRSFYSPQAKLTGGVTTEKLPDMWTKVFNNNPASPDYGKTMLVPNTEVIGDMGSLGTIALAGTGQPFVKPSDQFRQVFGGLPNPFMTGGASRGSTDSAVVKAPALSGATGAWWDPGVYMPGGRLPAGR